MPCFPLEQGFSFCPRAVWGVQQPEGRCIRVSADLRGSRSDEEDSSQKGSSGFSPALPMTRCQPDFKAHSTAFRPTRYPILSAKKTRVAGVPAQYSAVQRYPAVYSEAQRRTCTASRMRRSGAPARLADRAHGQRVRLTRVSSCAGGRAPLHAGDAAQCQAVERSGAAVTPGGHRCRTCTGSRQKPGTMRPSGTQGMQDRGKAQAFQQQLR